MTRYLATPKGQIAGPDDLFAAGRSVLALVKNVVQRMRNRRAVTKLLDWDDHALRDIGLSRGDVHLALGVSAGEDPSTRLASWVSERREARLHLRDSDGPATGSHLRVVLGRSRSIIPSISRR